MKSVVYLNKYPLPRSCPLLLMMIMSTADATRNRAERPKFCHTPPPMGPKEGKQPVEKGDVSEGRFGGDVEVVSVVDNRSCAL